MSFILNFYKYYFLKKQSSKILLIKIRLIKNLLKNQLISSKSIKNPLT